MKLRLRLSRVSIGTLAVWTWMAVGLPGQELTGRPWVDMDYGPFLTASIEVEDGNIAYKGVAVRLDEGPGGVSFGRAFMVFDTDTLRVAGGWVGRGFIDWRNVVFDGSHGTHPRAVGTLVFSNGPGPGWADPVTGSFADDRRVVGRDGRRYGPLPREHAHWRGLYRYGHRVVFHYTVGDTVVYELPGLHERDTARWLTRTLEVSPHTQPLFVRLADVPDSAEFVETSATLGGGWWVHTLSPRNSLARKQVRREGWLHLDGDTYFEVPPETVERIRYGETDLTVVARLRIGGGGTVLALTPPDDTWRRDGKTLFVRNRHLVFDICDVGQCISAEQLTEGEWHTVALTWSRSTGAIRMYIDGRPVQLRGRVRLVPHGPVSGYVLRIGRTSRQFPRGIPLNFQGDLDWIAVFDRTLSDEEVAKIGSTAPDATLVWDFDGDEPTHQSVVTRGSYTIEAVLHRDEAGLGRTVPTIAVVSSSEKSPIRRRGNRVLLELAPNPDSELLKVAYGVTDGERRVSIEEARGLPVPESPSRFVKGGPPLWGQELETRPARPEKVGSFEVVDLAPPVDNPWRSWLRFGGLDFMTSDPDRLVVCNWQGDVWLVRGLQSLDGDSPRLIWRRIASGLFQPLGLKIVDDTIYVLGRDQITILRDLNGDGEADYYENFNNDHQVTEHFHEFAMDLQVGPDGDFYYTKGGRHALDAVVPQHGTLLRVARDGSRTDIVAWGFRAPNGLGISARGEFVVSDQQGHWTPANRINYVRPGKFYGYMWAYHPGPPPETYEPPICWLPQDTDRSPAEQLWVTPESWGVLHGRMLSLSYGTGKIFIVPYEIVGDVAQGGVTALPLEFPTGIMRGRFHPKTDDLYVCGLFGWSSNKTQPGGLYRIRYRGGPLYVPVEMACYEDGLLLTFSDPLDRSAAEDPRNYFLEQWNYRWAQRYGSDQWKVSNPVEQGRDEVPILDAVLMEDGRSVFLRLERLHPVMQMRLNYRLRAADGTEYRDRFDFTVNAVRPLPEDLAKKVLRPVSLQAAAARPENGRRGLKVRFSALQRPQRTDVRVDRMPALFVPAGGSPTPFLPPGAFAAEYEGYLQVTEPGRYRFFAAGSGWCEVSVAGAVVWSGELLDDFHQVSGGTTVELGAGYVNIRIRYRSRADGRGRLRVYWESDRFSAEPLPPAQLWHVPDGEVQAGQMLRRGRELYLTLRCNRCHGPLERSEGPYELSMDAPSLADAGQRLRTDWIASWVLNPAAARGFASMPRLLPDADPQSVRAAHDIAAFLATLGGPHGKGDEPALAAGRGRELWAERGCVACHRLEGGTDEYDRLSLGYVFRKFTPTGLADYLEDPLRRYRWNPMPDFKLTAEEAGQLAAFLMSTSPVTTSRSVTVEGDAKRGQELVKRLRCGACHDFGAANRGTGEAGLDRLIPMRDPARGCQVIDTPDGSGKPAYDLGEDDRAALTHWLRAGRPGLDRHVPAEFARRAIQRLRCTACHRLDGGAEVLRAVLIDEGYVETIPPELPDLTWVGEKLQPAWVRAFLEGTLPYRPRPWLAIRMPCFPACAEGLAAGLAAQHGYPPDYRPRVRVDEELAEIGARLIRLEGGFNCVQCHGVGSEPPTAPFENRGVNLSFIRERLTEEYYYRWVSNPTRIDPGTKMPQLVGADGTSPVKHVFGGNAELQFRAIWHYLQTLRPDGAAASHPGGG